MQNLDAKRAGRILIAQVVATLVVSLIGLTIGLTEGLFALIGGATATLANGMFAWLVLGRYEAAEPGRIVGQFYAAEFLKLVAIVTAFVLAMLWLDPVSPLALFGAYFVVQVIPPLLANRIGG
jgi:ATP synthase protein I